MKTLRRICNIVTSLLVILLVLLATALVGVRLVGLQVFTIMSGSMEPAYRVGSLIYVQEIDYRELEAGDVITFTLFQKSIATHRIVEVVPDDVDSDIVYFRTKGDANDAEDGSMVHCQNVVGKTVATVPYLGYLADYLQKPPGKYVAVSAGVLLMILVFLPDSLWGNNQNKKWEKSRKNGKYVKQSSDASPLCNMPQLTQEDIQAMEDISVMTAEEDSPLSDFME